MKSRFEIKRIVDNLLDEHNIKKTYLLNINILLNSLNLQHQKISFKKYGMDCLGCIYRNIIITDDIIPKNREKYLIAHMLGHNILHKNIQKIFEFKYIEYTMNEREADTFANELILPEEYIREKYYRLKTPDLSEISKIFNINQSLMECRLIELGLKYE